MLSFRRYLILFTIIKSLDFLSFSPLPLLHGSFFFLKILVGYIPLQKISLTNYSTLQESSLSIFNYIRIEYIYYIYNIYDIVICLLFIYVHNISYIQIHAL